MRIGKKDIVFVAIILIALCFLILLNHQYRLFAIRNNNYNKTEDADFSIMTFNVAATGSAYFTEDIQDKLFNLIEAEHPDILCFQELSQENYLIIKPLLDSLYGEFEGSSWDANYWRKCHYSYFPTRNFSKHKCTGAVDTTKMTMALKDEVYQLYKQMPIMSVDLEVKPGRWIKLYSGHLRSNGYSTARRSMNQGDKWADGLSLYWRNYKMGKRIRDFEAQNVRDFVNDSRSKGLPVIVAGDLNDWCGSKCLKTLMGSDLKDAWWEGGNGFGSTFYGWNMWLRIDHILYSDDLMLVEVKVVDSDLSDHKPLVARFKLI